MRLVFDLFGVILTSGLSSSIKTLEEIYGLSRQIITPVYRKWEIPFDLGEIDSRQFWTNINSELNVRLDWHQLNEAVLNAYSRVPASQDLIRRAKGCGSLALFSNTRSEWYEYLDHKFSFSHDFDQIILSYEMKGRKPNKKAFASLIRTLDVPATDIMLIDDEEANIVAARRMGIDAIRFQSAFEVEPQIQERFPNLKYAGKSVVILALDLGGRIICRSGLADRGADQKNRRTLLSYRLNDGDTSAALQSAAHDLHSSTPFDQTYHLGRYGRLRTSGDWEVVEVYFVGQISETSPVARSALETIDPNHPMRKMYFNDFDNVVIDRYLELIEHEQ